MALRRGPRSRAGTDDDSGGYGGTPPDLVRGFVDEVTWFMSENKISRADLAQSMGVSPGRVSQILSGDENLTLRTLSGVAAALGAEIELALRAIDGDAADGDAADGEEG
jgi:transcriptional regulator with XRE-family HTH domain